MQVSERLQQARQADLDAAADTSLGPVAEGDYLAQAEKASSAIRDLNEHSDVPRSEVTDALFVPPKHISPAMKAELVDKLKKARALDDQKWHNNLGSEDEAWLTLLWVSGQGERHESSTNSMRASPLVGSKSMTR